MIFDIENLLSFWHFRTRQQFLGKASWDTYDRCLILQDFFKNWVAEGVASKVNDSTGEFMIENFMFDASRVDISGVEKSRDVMSCNLTNIVVI